MDFSECYQHTCSAVALAAREGNHSLVSKLIQKGYSADVSDNRGWNPLHEAAFRGSYECVRTLIKAASSSRRRRDYVNSPAHDSTTPLLLAAQKGHARVAKVLLRAGADANRATDDDTSPLFAAVSGGHMEVVELLARNGAEVDRAHSVSRWSCLHQAAFKGHAEIVRLLAGVARVNAVDDFEITPLFVAAQYGQRRCLEILADAGANVNCQSHDLATPMLIASQEGHLNCVEALLDRGADPNLYCNEEKWQLPVHAAAEFGHVRVLERLLAVTDRVCDRGAGKVSPVYSAVLRGQAETLRVLLREGYSPDAQECPAYGYSSPLAAALCTSAMSVEIRGRVPGLVRALLGAGARVDGGLYARCLEQDLPYLLEPLLERGGVPVGEHLAELVRTGLARLHAADVWLPPLLRAGLDPAAFLRDAFFEKARSDVLCFFLEFTNWKMLPPSLRLILSHRQAESTWNQQQQFDSPPSLCHLCRLAVRGVVGSEALARGVLARRLPVPPLLQDYLRFADAFAPRHLPKQRPPGEREYLGYDGPE
ncbi:ankyrin repeat and SOCS box protein 3 isoform X1 [Anguilla rostrata]|uniref:ankyrin repeat and SOCS box protein 3 isoform X1 n=1 Tax=Anguilla rostrata TaxID=7938 RepID=UPI0030CDA93D